MDNKRTIVEELIPLYKLESRVLIGLKIDYPGDKITDGLVLEIDVKEKRIINDPWSGQKKLKFGYYDSVNESERSPLLDLIADRFELHSIREMIDLLMNPTEEAISSLIWIPDRLTKVDITSILDSLRNRRKIFHSEDDMKLSFGMEILNNYPECQVRLERPVDIEMFNWNNEKTIARAPIDVVILDKNGDIIPIELKYKTKSTELEFEGEKYRLTDHGAVDIGRYSFRKDIYRIEQYILSHTNSKTGYVLILTNDNAYFDKDVSNKENFDKYLSFHDGAVINSEDRGWYYGKINKDKYDTKENNKRWWFKGNKKVHWTCSKELFYKLDLMNDYKVDWITYSSLADTEFKYCLIRIDKK
jgi:hypothetical protein